MGGFDVYCVICGSAVFNVVEGGHGYDPGIVTNASSSWTGDVRLISENPDARAASKVFVTGPAVFVDAGFFDFDQGDDPNTPVLDRDSLQVYNPDGDDPFAVPFHRVCLELFQKVIAPREVDNEILWQVLKCVGPDPVLHIDYGAVVECQDQYWVEEKGTEEFVVNPIDIPWLERYRDPNKLPTAGDSGLGRPGLPPRQTLGQDPFQKLPPEILFSIMRHLDLPSINRLREASRQASQLELSNGFWRSRLLRDMPWLYDLNWAHNTPTPGDVHGLDAADWTKIYRDLYLASNSGGKNKVHGLVNRRRIWGICEQIAALYSARDLAVRDGSITEVMRDVCSTRFAQLILRDPPNTTVTRISLLTRYADLESTTPVLSVHWTQDGELSKLNIMEPASEGTSPLRDDVQIPEGDWITGLIIYSEDAPRNTKGDPVQCSTCGLCILFAKQDSVKLRKATGGNQRLLRRSTGHFLVGFNVHNSQEGLISKLALLEQPKEKIPFTYDRIIDHNSHLHSRTASVEEHTWKGDLPPPRIKFSGLLRGYWAVDRKQGTAPLEALVFGNSEDELDDIISIGADVHFGGFEVHYGSRTPKAIGPRCHAMQYLGIDGRGGERVVSIYLSVSHIPVGCRFVTNRGRQLVVGQAKNEMQYHGGANGLMAGIAAYWSDRPLPQANLTNIGVLWSGHIYDDLRSDGLEDPDGFFWAPDAPPDGISESGPIWGQREAYDKWQRRNKNYPSSNTVVSWLDLRQPVDEVRVTFCHSTLSRQLPLAAITLVQSGRLKTIGAEKFSKPLDRTGTNGHHWCWCALGRRQDDELKARPHHIHESWQVGRQKLKDLKLWMTEDDGITGIQLVAADSAKSPAWGVCENAPSATIGFESGDGPPAVGVKFFLDDNERQVTRSDIIITAVQALVENRVGGKKGSKVVSN